MRYYYDGAADHRDDDDEDDEGARAGARAGRDGDGTLDEDDPGDADDTGGEDDGELEAHFPGGDGTADTSALAYCPYCGELNELAVDPGGGSPQLYVEDCHVCCRPWRVRVTFDREGRAVATLEGADG